MKEPIAPYPLKFIPQLKEKVWGGSKLASSLNKGTSKSIGESWEISAVTGHVSVVANGAWKDSYLDALIHDFPKEILGSSVFEQYGAQFPLLFKFIDAKEDLSVQVHPNDEVAKRRHQSFGKTEMWYILQADRDSRLILGFENKVNKETYLEHLSEGKLLDMLHEEPVTRGDAFYLAPGTVHAIGGGILLAEIQQTSNITYRIYDWDRPDINGEFRELHTQEALDVIDFAPSTAKLDYKSFTNQNNLICESPYFVTSEIRLTKPMVKDYKNLDSFVVYMCVDGSMKITTKDADVSLQKGETVLLPAAIKEVVLTSENATILEVFVPNNL